NKRFKRKERIHTNSNNFYMYSSEEFQSIQRFEFVIIPQANVFMYFLLQSLAIFQKEGLLSPTSHDRWSCTITFHLGSACLAWHRHDPTCKT
ncbi:hypothetical protein VIGAN_10081800, partial [Vigna angularis var. angularis]